MVSVAINSIKSIPSSCCLRRWRAACWHWVWYSRRTSRNGPLKPSQRATISKSNYQGDHLQRQPSRRPSQGDPKWSAQRATSQSLEPKLKHCTILRLAEMIAPSRVRFLAGNGNVIVKVKCRKICHDHFLLFLWFFSPFFNWSSLVLSRRTRECRTPGDTRKGFSGLFWRTWHFKKMI